MAIAFLAFGCRQGAPTTAASAEETSPACAEVLTAAARSPKLGSFAVLVAEARARGDEADIARLAAVACPLAWSSALEGPDASLARRVLARCQDAEAPLALVCARRGSLSSDEADALVAWASLHPALREEDGPAVRAALAQLERAEGPRAATDALARVAYPQR